MIARILIGLILVSLGTNALASTNQELQESRKPTAEASASQTNRSAQPLRSDIEKMQILLGQMQRNVAFVSAGDTPLKHQLQLEIEMWQILLRDMEKKAGNEAP